MMDKDKINFADLREVASSTFSIIDKVQYDKKELQAIAIACAFKLLVDVHNLSVSDVMETANRMIKDADGRYRREFEAIREYFKGELR